MDFYCSKSQFFFKFYLIDLPGLGKNRNLSPIKTDKLIELLYHKMPKNSIWLGWSIGGLIVSQFALAYPEHVLAVISVSSSPCFIEKKNWPGIKKDMIYNIYNSLKTNYYQTINDFLNVQKIGSKKFLKNVLTLKKILFSQPKPTLELLKIGLDMILLYDLRIDLTFIKVPFLRIYGSLDNLIPKKIVKILDKKWPKTNSIIIEKAYHAPFISHEKKFCSILLNFTKIF